MLLLQNKSYIYTSKFNKSVSTLLIGEQKQTDISAFTSTVSNPTGQTHPYHLVDLSPWPLQTSIVLGTLVSSFVLTFSQFSSGSTLFWIALVLLILHKGFWFSDITSEGTFNGDHTITVVRGLVLGMSLFILTEAVFFGFIFWSYLHNSLSPAVEIGVLWPPLGIEPLEAKAIPSLNTALLLASGASVTWSHHALIGGRRQGALLGLILTIVFALIFTGFQVYEYFTATFTMADSIYGNIFYLGTGGHGMHVIVGTCILLVALTRIVTYHFSSKHHVGYESGILYWHFVDIVWLVLYVIFYWWGS